MYSSQLAKNIPLSVFLRENIQLYNVSLMTCIKVSIYFLQALKDSSGYYGERKIGHLVDIKVRVECENNKHSFASIDDKNRFGGSGKVEVWFG